MKQETKEITDHLREEGLERLQESGHRYAQLSHLRQPEVPTTTRPPPEIDEQRMWDEFESDRLDTSLPDANAANQFNLAQWHEIEFNRTLDRAETSNSTEWGTEDFGIECDVDETLTNVMQDLGQSLNPFFLGPDKLTTSPDPNNSLAEEVALADIGLSNSESTLKSDEWFPYPNKIVSVSRSITQGVTSHRWMF